MWFWEGGYKYNFAGGGFEDLQRGWECFRKEGLNKKGVKRKEREGVSMTFKEIMDLGFLPEYFNNFVIHFFSVFGLFFPS